MDVLLLPPTIFVFSKLPTGWFRAYKAMLNVSQENWLRDETDVHGTKWLLYFKQHLTQSGPGGLLPPFHAIIEWTRENTVTALEGLPLTARSKWQVLEGGTALVGRFFLSSFMVSSSCAILLMCNHHYTRFALANLGAASEIADSNYFCHIVELILIYSICVPTTSTKSRQENMDACFRKLLFVYGFR